MALREALSRKNTSFAKLINYRKITLGPDPEQPSPQVRHDIQGYRPHRRLTPAERTQLVEQYKLGLSAIELARQYGIHKHTVAQHLKRQGIVLRGSRIKLSPDVIDQARQLYEAGNSLVSIGEQLGIDPSGICRALKRAGTTMRDTHGREK